MTCTVFFCFFSRQRAIVAPAGPWRLLPVAAWYQACKVRGNSTFMMR